jgi:CheY-like chemotaxis protein
MDAQMPEMNGSDACQEIRRLEREAGRPRVPILALTANVMRHQIEAYEAAGMDGYVAKPIDASALFSSIEAALDTAQAA